MSSVTVKVAPNSAIAALRFSVELTYQHRYSVPLRTEGQVKAEDGQVIGYLHQAGDWPTLPKFGILPRSNQTEPTQVLVGFYDCPLSDRALAHLVEVRDKNRRKDVVLRVSLQSSFLYPRFVTSPGGTNQPQPGVVTADQTSWGPGLGEIGVEQWNHEVTIFSSQWTTDYSPAFGIGRFLVFEVPTADAPLPLALPLSARLQAASSALSEMDKDIQAGEWTDCVQHSRPVLELLKNPPEKATAEVIGVLKADGLSTVASEDIVKAIAGAFDFASKFLKKVERGTGDVNPDLVAKKEDAYYVYSNCTALVHLLSRKSMRAAGISIGKA